MSERTLDAPSPVLRELADEEVVRRVAGGESELFELLMRRHNQKLYRVLLGALGDADEAEEALQEAWVRAYEHLGEFRGEARLTTWLIRIALHEAWRRRRHRSRQETLEPERAAAISDLEPSPERLVLGGELRAAIERSVLAMPAGLRTVFLLRQIEGLSTEETGTLLGLSAANVKVRLHRARQRLREQLERSLGETAPSLFGFAGDRCDRTVGAVFGRLGLS